MKRICNQVLPGHLRPVDDEPCCPWAELDEIGVKKLLGITHNSLGLRVIDMNIGINNNTTLNRIVCTLDYKPGFCADCIREILSILLR